MKRIYTILMALSLLSAAQAQRQTAAQFRDNGRQLTLTYEISPIQPGSDYAYTVSPLLCSNRGDTLALEAVTWRGKRNAQKWKRTLFFEGVKEDLPPYFEADDTLTRSFSVTLETTNHPWLTEAPLHLCFLNDIEGCCNVDQSQTTGKPFIYLPPFVPQIPEVEDRTGKEENLRTNELGLFVYFPLDKATLNRNFRRNAEMLDSIVAITRRTLADAKQEVKRIQLIGQASPDGPQKRNLWLGEHRAKALRDYICNRIEAPDSLFTIVNGGEGWAELREQIGQSDMPERDTLLAIIDSEADPDLRELRIKRLYGGKTYDFLRENVLADQRNSGYMHIRYEFLPDKEAQAINHAIRLIHDGQYAEGISLLEAVRHDERSLNALGCAYYLTGEKDKAVELLKQAAGKGNPSAVGNLKQLLLLEKRKQEIRE